MPWPYAGAASQAALDPRYGFGLAGKVRGAAKGARSAVANVLRTRAGAETRPYSFW